jgi:hypothetical protein
MPRQLPQPEHDNEGQRDEEGERHNRNAVQDSELHLYGSLSTVGSTKSAATRDNRAEPSIEDSVFMAEHIRHQCAGLPIFPAPALIENREADKLAAARGYARRVFAPFLLHVQSDQKKIDPAQQAPYWREVETPTSPTMRTSRFQPLLRRSRAAARVCWRLMSASPTG